MTVERPVFTHPIGRRPQAAREAFIADTSSALTRMLAAVLALHGIAHFAGTSDSLGKAGDGGSVEYLAGAWSVSDPSLLRLLGAVWALVGVGFALAAALTWRRWPRWPRVVAGVTTASLVVVAVTLWASVVGVVIDLALVLVAWRAGGFRHERGRR